MEPNHQDGLVRDSLKGLFEAYIKGNGEREQRRSILQQNTEPRILEESAMVLALDLKWSRILGAYMQPTKP